MNNFKELIKGNRYGIGTKANHLESNSEQVPIVVVSRRSIKEEFEQKMIIKPIYAVEIYLIV